PYWPKKDKYPIGRNGEPMIMIAQLNFSELPHLNGYPRKGILQFFVNDAEYNDTGDKNIKVFYHERPVTEEYDMLNDIPRTTFQEKEYDFPFTGMYKITKGVMEKQCLQYSCEKFNSILNPIIEKNFHVSVKSLWDLPKSIYDRLLKKISENSWGTRIGGYPNFTQWDPRHGDEYQTLLFQLDSEKGIMWGDVGIANWFIDEKNLKVNNFNKVYFTWDCY
ncbi:MAG: YwqG family protein, partial [Roseburia sp.]|nr:YwqG family protein [Roseburia sp.]